MSRVNTYVGEALLLDELESELGEAQVSLATIDATTGSWRGYAHGLDASLLDGREVWVRLPGGLSGKARVVLDLTGAEPIVTLVGVGPGPI